MGADNGQGKARKLTLILVVVGILAIGLLISTVILGVKLKHESDKVKQSESNGKKDEVCLTEECTKAAGDILKAMDRSVNPCENFFEFSCGNWVRTNPIPETSSSWNQFNILREELSRKVRAILESGVDPLDPKPVQQAKKYYESCISQESPDQSELRNLIDVVLKVPEIDNGNVGLKLGEIRRRTGGQLLINSYVELNEENTQQYIIYIDQPSLGLNRAFLVVDHANKIAYRELIEQVWPLVYENEPPGFDYAELANKLVDFEAKIATISTAPEDRRNRTELYNLKTISELQSHSSSATMLDWSVYVTEVFKDAVQKHNVSLGDVQSLKVVVRDMKYYEQLGEVLTESIATDPDILQNYVKWRVMLAYGNDISEKLRDVMFQFSKKTTGTLYPTPRWQMCADRVNAAYGMAISLPYVKEVLGDDFSSQMTEMITNIQESFYDIIDTIEWIGSEETRDKAKAKAGKMNTFIGYPDWLVNNSTALDHYYNGLNLSAADSYFHNLLEISKWRNMEVLRNIKESKDSSRWITDPTVVNAFYSSTYNSISFPAGILQPPFYFTGKPIQALNYGAVGMVIGHEITHGFDDRGRQSDGDGNLVNWWDEETVKQYVSRAECFVSQYSAYKAEEADMNLNGNNTLGENIADNGGLRQAFQAYKSFVQKHGEEPKLPGLDYTPEQLFFLAFGQIWCGSYTTKGMENQIRTGVHSPNRFRVRGALDNSVEFAETWNCPLPDTSKSCKIW